MENVATNEEVAFGKSVGHGDSSISKIDGVITINVLEAKDLHLSQHHFLGIGDISNDPYVVAHLSPCQEQEKAKSKHIVKGGSNPKWGESDLLNLNYISQVHQCSLYIEVLNHAAQAGHDLMGKVSINLSSIIDSMRSIVVDKVYDLLDKDGKEGKYGTIHLKISFEPKAFSPKALKLLVIIFHL